MSDAKDSAKDSAPADDVPFNRDFALKPGVVEEVRPGLRRVLCGNPSPFTLTGTVQGWLSPRGTSKLSSPKLLVEAGYRWYGDVFDADLPYVQEFGNKKIVAIPLSYDVNDMPSMKYGNPPKMMLDSFNEVIDIARSDESELRIIDVTSHAHIFGHHRGAYYYEKIIEKAMSGSDIWVGTRAQIAEHVLAQR